LGSTAKPKKKLAPYLKKTFEEGVKLSDLVS